MNESEVRRLQTQLRALQRRQRREAPPPTGLARSAVGVLAAVSRRPQGCQPGQIADEMVMTSSNVAAALRELEAAGLVSRQRDGQDTRRVNVFLTGAGTTLLADTRHGRDSWLGGAVNALLDPDQQATLIAAGELIQRLSEYAGTTDRE